MRLVKSGSGQSPGNELGNGSSAPCMTGATKWRPECPTFSTDDDKAILGELMGETIERDRFPAVATGAQLQDDPRQARPASAATRAKPPGERSMALTRKRRR
jgi:hypothetical protein